MSIWFLLLAVAVAGGVGGAANALLSEGGLPFPKREKVGERIVWQPGWVGAVVAGVVAGAASWGLYGPAAQVALLSTETSATPEASLSLSALIGALLVGFGGGRWLSTEVDKRIAEGNTASALTKTPNPTAAVQLGQATPREAAEILEKL